MVREEGEREGTKMIKVYKEDVEVKMMREKKEKEEEAERKKRPEDRFPH